MEATLQNAFVLLLIGMSTVFIAIALIVNIGALFIIVINRVKVDVVDMPFTNLKTELTQSQKKAIIQKAIHLATHGKAEIKSIEKVQ